MPQRVIVVGKGGERAIEGVVDRALHGSQGAVIGVRTRSRPTRRGETAAIPRDEVAGRGSRAIGDGDIRVDLAIDAAVIAEGGYDDPSRPGLERCSAEDRRERRTLPARGIECLGNLPITIDVELGTASDGAFPRLISEEADPERGEDITGEVVEAPVGTNAEVVRSLTYM